MARRVKVEGLRELDKALGELPKAAARGVLHRVLKRAAKPLAETAAALAPDDPKTGAPDLHRSIRISTRLANPVGKAEFAAAMKAGQGKGAAVKAMRDARRSAKASGMTQFAMVFVGPTADQSRKGILQEFGTVHHGPNAFMRPAWATEQDRLLASIADDLAGEIDRTAKRVAARAAARAARG